MRDALALWSQELGDVSRIEQLVRSCGWDFVQTANWDDLAAVNRQRRVLSVLFHPASLGFECWRAALSAVQKACPKSLPIVGRDFSDQTPWPEMAEAGVFHSFLIPVDPDELRQS